MTIILIGLTLVSCVAMIFTMIIMITIMTTRPKPAYGQQGLAGDSLRTSSAQLGSGK